MSTITRIDAATQTVMKKEVRHCGQRETDTQGDTDVGAI
jgi:hypothetical protein